MPVGPRRAALTGRVGYCPDAKAFFARLATPPTAARKAIYNTLIKSLVAAGVWTKLDALYLFAASDSATALTNLVQSSYGAANNNAAFTADLGYAGNGTSAYLDTGFNPITAVGAKFARNDASFGVVAAGDGGYAGAIAGQTAGSPSISLYPRFTDDKYYFRANDTTSSSATVTGAYRVLSVSRPSSGSKILYVNGVSQGTVSQASAAPDSSNIVFLRERTAYYGGSIRAGWFGQALTAGEQLALYNAVAAYLVSVGALSLFINSSVIHHTSLDEPEDVLIVGTRAYVPCRAGATLTVLDISNPAAVSILSVFTDADLMQGMGVAANDSGSILYLTSWHNHKLLIIDASNPASLSKLSSITIGNTDPGGDPDELRKVAYQGGYCFCTHAYDGKLYIVDVSNPASPSIAGSVATSSFAFAVAISGNYAYVSPYTDPGLGTPVKVVDISNKASPSVVKTLQSSNYDGLASLALDGSGHLFGVCSSSNKFLAFDVSDPPNMAQISVTTIAAMSTPNRLSLNPAAAVAYVASSVGDGVVKINVANPASPAVAASTFESLLDQCYGLAYANGKVAAVGRAADSFALLNA